MAAEIARAAWADSAIDVAAPWRDKTRDLVSIRVGLGVFLGTCGVAEHVEPSCPAGHAVDLGWRYCAECGARVDNRVTYVAVVHHGDEVVESRLVAACGGEFDSEDAVMDMIDRELLVEGYVLG